ncbi:MAG: hypothetical protein FWE22_00155 [Firmicutes bacterium]|nr:hypothetical protein [Bacillota bacterium]
MKNSKKLQERQLTKKVVHFKEDIVDSVTRDYNERARERSQFEAQWQLNANFVIGRQHCLINAGGEIEDLSRDFFWQEREVFNHIAPIIESRQARLSRVRPRMAVRARSSDDAAVRLARLSTKIIDGAYQKLELEEKILDATYWSELTGSAFYKVSWDNAGGREIGKVGSVVGNQWEDKNNLSVTDNRSPTTDHQKPVFEGELRIDICPPYEIFPNSILASNIDECQSIIHAKAVEVSQVERIWKAKVKPTAMDVLSQASVSFMGGARGASSQLAINREKSEDYCLVIERYTRPTSEMPEGELAIVVGDVLLHYGPLPYINGEDGKRDLPFIRQVALTRPGCFFGTSMIERCIPIQRAYNAVKNRKHEFLNRIATGVLAVEDGSVDIDNLQEEGLAPGKILSYRQGSVMPRMLDIGRVPPEFNAEEDRLLHEFITTTGVSEIMRSSNAPNSVNSGIALQLLIEQDDTRLMVSAEQIKHAARKLSKHLLRLYKQFATNGRLLRVAGPNGETEVLTFNSHDIVSDDVIFLTENELSNTPAARQNMMFELLRMGVFHDEQGKLSDTTRFKILQSLGYGDWEFSKDVEALHINRAEKENLNFMKEPLQVLEVDDHTWHISIHTKFMLTNEFNSLAQSLPELKEKMLEHIREHKVFERIEEVAEVGVVT